MAASKKRNVQRTASEFSVSKLLKGVLAPSSTSCAYAWDLPAIMSARDDQLCGRFARPVQLARSMRTDDALMVAWKNRLAPLRCLDVALKPARGARGASICTEAEPLFGADGISVSRETVADLNDGLANHGVAIGCNTWLARDDGSRVDVVHRAWPLEYVVLDSTTGQLSTQVASDTGGTSGSFYEPIVHGDGRWVIYSTHEREPWAKDAAVLAAALVWARHALGARAWSKASDSHGNAKVLGTLPEGQDLQVTDENGNEVLSAWAQNMLAIVEAVASLDSAFGLMPPGAKIEYLTNSSRAWEVWERLMLNAERAAARIYLGTDGTLGATGGAPGVDIAQLFGVATTIVQGDIAAITRGIRTGVMEPWAAINFGDSLLCPTREYVVVDPDVQRVRAEVSSNEAAFTKAIQDRRAAGFTVTQEWVDELADRMGVDRLELAAAQATGFQPAPTDAFRVLLANEVRAALGAPAREDGDVPAATWGQASEVAPDATVP